MFDEYSSHDLAVYAAYLTDDASLIRSASGGIAAALAEHMLDQGGWVAGVAYSSDFYSAEYVLINDKQDLPRLRGSKYIECDKQHIYTRVQQLLDTGERVLFFGLPCTVAALYRRLGTRPDTLVTCELVCHGPTDPRVHREYLRWLEACHGSKIVDFSVRHKKGAWTPAYLYARFADGQVFEQPFNNTEYGYAFYTLGRRSCYRCRFKGNNRQADLMIGDFWGAGEKDPFWNPLGVSCVFSETGRGDAFLGQTPGIRLFPTTFEAAVRDNPMVIRSKEPSPDRERFAELLKEEGLFRAAARLHTP